MTDKPATLAAALAELQTRLPHVAKGETANAGTYSYSYAGLGRVSKDLLPVMGALGLSFSCKPTLNVDGKFVLAYKLRHSPSEEVDSGEWPLPNGSPQQIGSALTYGRRYTLLAITGLAPDEDDDDGKAASDTRMGSYEPDSEPEQDDRTDMFAEEISTAADVDAIGEIGGRVKRARNAKRITQGQYGRLSDLASAKLATFAQPAQKPAAPTNPGSMTQRTRGRMFALFTDLGYGGDENQQIRRDICGKILDRTVESVGALSEGDGLRVVEALAERKAKT